MHGRDLTAVKQRAIDNLAAAGVRVTLLHVMARDLNEDATGGLLELMRTNDNILSLTVQTMTYTGQGGGGFPDRRHMPVDEAAQVICEHSGGELRFERFRVAPGGASAVLSDLLHAPRQRPDAAVCTIRGRSEVERLMSESYLIRPGGEERFFRDVVDDLYARGDEEYLPILRRVAGPTVSGRGVAGRVRSAADRRGIGAHGLCARAHGRGYVRLLAGDDVSGPCAGRPGRLIPACTYNLFYRMKDERFYVC